MMIGKLLLLTIALGLFSLTYKSPLVKGQILHSLDRQSLDNTLAQDEQLWGKTGDKAALLKAINYSLDYLKTAKAIQDYQNYPVHGVTRERVRRSLLRFRTLLQQSTNAEALERAVKQEFVWYESAGKDGLGTVHFTGYFEPIYRASRQRTSEYIYPLYRKPGNFSTWTNPHPTRQALEGKDGLLGKKSPLAGYELVWLKDRLEAYLVHVQGSAQLLLPNGQMMGIGFDGSTNYPYTSIGKELIAAGIFTPEIITLPLVIDYLEANPEQQGIYLPRNNRFIFFRETSGKPPQGSLGVPVTAERSIATDKSIMPPGALALISAPIPEKGSLERSVVSRFVLDQDTGSAIKGAGRVDIFMGTGKSAGDRAGLINHDGKLYYLLLRK